MTPAAAGALLGACLLAAGCSNTLSIRPLVAEKDAVVEPALAGLWQEVDGDTQWDVRPAGGHTYEAGNSKDSGKYRLRLTRINGTLFADMWAAGVDNPAIEGHMFLRLRVAQDKLVCAFLDSKQLRQEIVSLNWPAHVPVEGNESWGGDRIILTGPTAELRDFVKAYSDRPDVFGDEGEFRRVR